MNRISLRPALFGGAAWFLLLIGWGLALPNLGLMELLVLLAPLVVLPIGFSLMEEFQSISFMRAAIQMQPIAAFLAAGSYLLPPSDLAAALAVPWCVVTFTAAMAGLVRLRRSLADGFPSLLMTAGLFFLPVGGANFGSNSRARSACLCHG